MTAFDAAAYRKNVIVPTAGIHARALQQAVTEMRGAKTTRPSSFDLAFLYDIVPGMTDLEIATRIDHVEVDWNNEFLRTRDARRKAAAALVRELHKLLETRNANFRKQSWWADSIAQKEQAKRDGIAGLSKVLRHSPFAALKYITAARLASVATNDPSFSSFDEQDLVTAAKDAGLTVVQSVELPTDPGIGTYSSVVAKLNEATDRTIVHAVFFDDPPAKFSILGPGVGGRPFALNAGRRKLDADTTVKKRDKNNAGQGAQTTARDKVLSALADAAAKRVDLNALAVYHLADEARRRCQGGVLQLAYQYLVGTGLDATDAARIVLSLDTAAEVKPAATATAVRALLADGALGLAAQALTQFESAASAASAESEAKALRAALNDQRAKVEQLRVAAASAVGSNDIRAARTALRDAALLDRENEDIARDLASLPPEPPNNVSVATQSVDEDDGIRVRVSWQAGLGSDDETRYRVVRRVGSAPKNVDDGTVLGDATTTSIADERPELIDQVYYAVFATRGKAFSLPTVASISVVPGVGRLTLSTTPTGVAGHWVNPRGATEVTVVEIGPDGSRRKVPLSSPASFVSDALVQGARYQYEVAAHYRSRTGVAIASEPVVKDAVPRAEAQPVPSLTVKPIVTEGSVCRIEAKWSRQPAHEVQIWCFPQPPMWSYGTRVGAKALSDNGSQLHGQGADKGAVSTMVAEVAPALLHYVAVTIDGDEGIVGQVDQLGICAPVGNPRVERFGDEAVLSWDWPGADYSARAVWSGPSTSGEATITKARYESSGGMRIRVGTGRAEIRLTTFIDHADLQWQSPIRTVTVVGMSASIKYEIAWRKRLFGGASGFGVTVLADANVNGGELVIGYRADRVMPSSLKQIEELQREPLRLRSGEAVSYSVALPNMPKHYWVRCFLDDASGIRIVDPPTADLKGR